jgi:hypothetical protein
MYFFYYTWFTEYLKDSKSERRMPWLPRSMKDVVSCEKSRVFANKT